MISLLLSVETMMNPVADTFQLDSKEKKLLGTATELSQCWAPWEIEKYVLCIYCNFHPGYFSGRTAVSGRGCVGQLHSEFGAVLLEVPLYLGVPPRGLRLYSVKPALQTRTLVLL